jgi:glutamate dehydrogenase
LHTSLPDDPALDEWLVGYFPPGLQASSAPSLRGHRLRREIIATTLVNEMVNVQGVGFFQRMEEETYAEPAEIARAWLVARSVLALPHWWRAIDSLGSWVPVERQATLFTELRRVAERSTLWLLRRHHAPLDVTATIGRFGAGMHEIGGDLALQAAGAVGREARQLRADHVAAGVDDRLATQAASWPRLHGGFDIVDLSTRYGRSVDDVARVYWSLFDRLDLGWLWDRVGALGRQTRWTNQARSAIRDDLMDALRSLTDGVLRTGDALDAPDVLVLGWANSEARLLRRTLQLLTDVRAAGTFDLASLTVAVHQLWCLAPGPLSAGPHLLSQ